MKSELEEERKKGKEFSGGWWWILFVCKFGNKNKIIAEILNFSKFLILFITTF
jgi:hypothetical protein